MDFGLSEDQKMLQASVTRLLAERVPITQVRKLREQGCRNDRAIWRGLADLGATGILIPEQRGGSGLTMLDAALVAQALGHAVTPVAYLSAAVMVPIALQASKLGAGTEWLSGIAAGKLLFGVAVTETFSIREHAGITLQGGKLHGKAMMALDCVDADFILVAIGNHTLAVVAPNAVGLEVTKLATVDTTRCTSELLFKDVTPLAVDEQASRAIARMLDGGRIALAADAFGACESMIELAVAYAAQRRQFERVIGSFQAVKHMCAEMIAELEPARSLIWYAAHSFDALPNEAPLMVSHALAHVSEIGRQIAGTATQVHGGIGWTDDQNLHFWFKRIGTARHLLGGPELLRERAAGLQDLIGV